MTALWRHSKTTRRFVYVCSLVFAAIVLVPPVLIVGKVQFAALLWAFAVAMGYARLFPYYLRWRTKKDKRTLSIDPLRISTQIGRRSADVPWKKVRSVSVTDEHVFIQRSNLNAFTIPRGAFSDDKQRAEFIRLCEQYFAAAKKSA